MNKQPNEDCVLCKGKGYFTTISGSEGYARPLIGRCYKCFGPVTGKITVTSIKDKS